MPAQKPKKPRATKSRRLNLNSKRQWEHLLREVHKEQVPVDVLLSIKLYLKDGSIVEVNIAEMLERGTEPAVIEEYINQKLEDLDDYIDNVDFHISLESVVKVVKTSTDQLLKNL
jgi:hypothetical protein